MDLIADLLPARRLLGASCGCRWDHTSDQFPAADRPRTALFYLPMERGVFTAPSRVTAALSTAMADTRLDGLRQAMASSLDVFSEAMSDQE